MTSDFVGVGSVDQILDCAVGVCRSFHILYV